MARETEVRVTPTDFENFEESLTMLPGFLPRRDLKDPEPNVLFRGIKVKPKREGSYAQKGT